MTESTLCYIHGASLRQATLLTVVTRIEIVTIVHTIEGIPIIQAGVIVSEVLRPAIATLVDILVGEAFASAIL